MLKRILLVGMFVFCESVTAANVPVYMENQATINADKSHTEFNLKLKSNPTTGYSWFLIGYDKNFIKPTGHEYIKPDSKMIGQGGYEIWSFTMLPAAFDTPVTTRILMEYKRPWEIAGNSKKIKYQIVTN